MTFGELYKVLEWSLDVVVNYNNHETPININTKDQFLLKRVDFIDTEGNTMKIVLVD